MSDTTIPTRPWVPEDLERRIVESATRYRGMTSNQLEAEVNALVGTHALYMDHECISLYAGTNVMNPRAARLLSASVGSRPSLGYPGDKYETGMQYAEQLEVMAGELLAELFGCQYVEYRVSSGSTANLYAFMATTRPGDRVMTLAAAAGGHITTHGEGAAGLYGLEAHPLPYNAQHMAVDLDRLREQAHAVRPRLIIVGGSVMLFPLDVAGVRAIADEVGAYVMYDAAHMIGLIAAGEFQQPLAEGAHVMTCSTYKSFGGPPQGLVLTNDPELAQRLDRIAYPGMTANFDLAKLAALIVAALDLREFGREYARACMANASALADALDGAGFTVHSAPERGFTVSHHVALPAHPFGGGTRASRRLEQANILTSGIGLPLPPIEDDYNAIRIGTQEVTRWGMTPDTMRQTALLMARVLLWGEDPARVREDVIALRKEYQTLHYIRQ